MVLNLLLLHLYYMYNYMYIYVYIHPSIYPCTHSYIDIYNMQLFASRQYILASSPSVGQVLVATLVTHLDELSTLRQHLARGRGKPRSLKPPQPLMKPTWNPATQQATENTELWCIWKKKKNLFLNCPVCCKFTVTVVSFFFSFFAAFLYFPFLCTQHTHSKWYMP